MTHIPEFDRLPGRVSAPFSSCWGADQLAGGELSDVPPAFFIPCVCVDGFGNGVQAAAERHERLVAASANAPVGYKRKTEQMARVALHERLAAELGAGL
ncbi:hypothetical protein phiGT1_52 [Sulfitobacter phage phiGT1]|nr:hypothetical protein phiGT1_52 [Sulfitobacter phage phiGT1]